MAARIRLVALVGILGLVLVACGGSGSAPPGATAAGPAEPAPAGDAATSAPEPAGGSEAADGSEPAADGSEPADTAAEAGGEEIVVGAAFPLSGPGSYFGVQDREGIDLAIEVLNEEGGFRGRPVRVEYEDSACSPLEATNAAQRLVQTVQPMVMLGEECSSATLAIMPIIERAQIPLVNAGSSAIAITQSGNDWTFRILPDEVMQGESIALNAYQQVGARRAVLLHENTDAGIGNADVFAENFEALGGEIVDRIGFDREVQDFTSIATRLAQLEDIDVIPTYTLEGQGVNITQALAQAGVTVGGGGEAIQMGTIWLPYTFEEQAGPAAEGYIRILQFVPEDTRPIVQDFVAAFEEKYGKTPSHINAHAYDQMLLIRDAIERGATDAESMREVLTQTEGLEGTTGTITFDESNQNIEVDTMHYVRTLPDGSLELLDWQ